MFENHLLAYLLRYSICNLWNQMPFSKHPAYQVLLLYSRCSFRLVWIFFLLAYHLYQDTIQVWVLDYQFSSLLVLPLYLCGIPFQIYVDQVAVFCGKPAENPSGGVILFPRADIVKLLTLYDDYFLELTILDSFLV